AEAEGAADLEVSYARSVVPVGRRPRKPPDLLFCYLSAQAAVVLHEPFARMFAHHGRSASRLAIPGGRRDTGSSRGSWICLPTPRWPTWRGRLFVITTFDFVAADLTWRIGVGHGPIGLPALEDLTRVGERSDAARDRSRQQ